MKRPSRITTVLVTTGIPPLVFTAALFVLGNIPEDVAPYLTIALVLVPMGVFLPVSAFVWLRHIARTQRQRFQKMIPTSCFICGEYLPKAPLRQVGQVQNPHYQTAHPDFWRWREEKWKRMFVAFLAVVLTLAAMAIYELLIANYLLFILGTALAVLLSLARTRFEKRKLRDFRNQWQPTTRDAHLEENHST